MEDNRDNKKSSKNDHHQSNNGVVTNKYKEKDGRDITFTNNDKKHISHISNERKHHNRYDTKSRSNSRLLTNRSKHDHDVQGNNQHKHVKKYYAEGRDKSRSRVRRKRSRSRDRNDSKYERRREHKHGENEYVRRNKYNDDVKHFAVRHQTKYTRSNYSNFRDRSGSVSRDRVFSKHHDRHHRDRKLGRKNSNRREDHRHSKDKKKNHIASIDKSPTKKRDRKHKYSGASSSSSSSKSSEKDLDHYKYKIGTVLHHKYKIEQFLGDGTFGRVLECRNINDNESYAVKVIRPVKRYIESAKIEAETIIDIIAKDINRESNCVLMIDYFHFEEQNNRYIALVFEKLGKSLYDFIKMNNYKGFPIHIVQSFAKQIFQGIGFLHDKLQLTHTDLKPENLLFKNSSYDTTKSKELWPKHVLHKEKKNRSVSPSTRSYSKDPKEKEEPYYIPVNPNIKIIDFGGATYKTERHSDIINTRQYRSPEVILGCNEWDEKSDIWSIACILVELYTGELFFPTHNNEEHLCLIEKASGCIPHWMADNCRKEFAKIFYSDKTDTEINKLAHRINFSKLSKKDEKLDALNDFETLDDLILEDHLIFRQFLKSLLIIDPTERPSCKESLKHEFFKFDFIKDNKGEDK